jgi:hypothetical protein
MIYALGCTCHPVRSLHILKAAVTQKLAAPLGRHKCCQRHASCDHLAACLHAPLHCNVCCCWLRSCCSTVVNFSYKLYASTPGIPNPVSSFPHACLCNPPAVQ